MAGLGPVLKRLDQEPVEQKGDAELLQEFLRHRSASAFETIVRRHGAQILRICQRELPVQADAEDAMQATFLLLAQKAHTIRQGSCLPAWLAGVARRLARRLARQLRRRRERLRELSDQYKMSSPSHQASWWEDERRHLPQEYQAVIDLCLIQGLTRDEAAVQLGHSSAAVHGMLYRARLKLKKQLLERGTIAGSTLAATETIAGAIERLSPQLAQTAVKMLEKGTLHSLVSPTVLGLVQRHWIAGWVMPFTIGGALLLGGLSWWNLSGEGSARASVSLPLVANIRPTNPLTSDTLPNVNDPLNVQQQSTDMQIDVPGQPPAQTLSQQVVNVPNDEKSRQQQVRGVPLPAIPNQANPGQTNTGKDAPFQTPVIPVPPADRVPTGSERLNLAKELISSAGSLHEGIVPLLPRQSKHAFDGDHLLLSIIQSEQEYRDSTEKAPPVKIPPNVQVMNDPAWNGGLFKVDWNTEVLLVGVILKPANSVTLQTMQKCWIPPDDKGVGHLLLKYDGKELYPGSTPGKSYPYVMLKVPRANLKQIAVSVWRAGSKPDGVISLPPGK